MNLKNFKKGDEVKILTGKDRGKSGKILEVRKKDGRVVVEGLNLVKEHRRPTKQGTKGQIISKPSPIHPSNLILVCSSCGKSTRVGFQFSETGEKSRRCRHCQKSI